MSIEAQQILTGRFGVEFVSLLGRAIPARPGYRLADFTADLIARRREWKIVRAVRANQWIVSGERLKGERLNHAVRQTFRATARTIFDIYHYIDDPTGISHLIVPNQTMRQWIRRPIYGDRGLIIVGLHLSGFDFVLQATCEQGFQPMVLTIPQPQGGRKTEFERRQRRGMNLVPASVGALRQALRHLQAGGMVLTGIDRPSANPGRRPQFFGRPASLPTDHVWLALKAKVPVVIATTIMQADGKYHVLTSDPIEMQAHPDREREIIQNAEAVLSVAEGFIRMAPEQWTMTLPVWPEALAQVPD
jgi:KDO2-lipid IV(A) lauroyltransferase